MSSKTAFDPSCGAALVTGGSSGMGLAFSRDLAAKGYDLIIASRDGHQTKEVASKIEKEFGVHVETIDVELGNRADVDKLVKRITDKKRPVDVVVNNAGFAVHDSLLDADTSRQEMAMDVMATAVLILSGAAARTMKRRGRGVIINVASISAWLFSGNYSAIKSWVVAYSEGLALELTGSGVRVTAVCPAWTKTNFHASAGVSRPNLPDWAWVAPEEVAKTAFRAVERGKPICMPTLHWRIATYFLMHFRWLSRYISRRKVARQTEHLKQKNGE